MTTPIMETQSISEIYKYNDIPSTPQIEQCTLTKNTVKHGDTIESQRIQISITHPYFLSVDISIDEIDSVIAALNYIKNNMP